LREELSGEIGNKGTSLRKKTATFRRKKWPYLPVKQNSCEVFQIWRNLEI